MGHYLGHIVNLKVINPILHGGGRSTKRLLWFFCPLPKKLTQPRKFLTFPQLFVADVPMNKYLGYHLKDFSFGR